LMNLDDYNALPPQYQNLLTGFSASEAKKSASSSCPNGSNLIK